MSSMGIMLSPQVMMTSSPKIMINQTSQPGQDDLAALSSMNPQAMQHLSKLPLFCFSEKSQSCFSKKDFGISEFICPVFPQWSP